MPIAKSKGLYRLLKKFYDARNDHLSKKLISAISRETSDIVYDKLSDQFNESNEIRLSHARELIWDFVILPLNGSDADLRETIVIEDVDNGSYLPMLNNIIKMFIRDYRADNSIGLIKVIDDLDESNIIDTEM
jgi:hypothetical protein